MKMNLEGSLFHYIMQLCTIGNQNIMIFFQLTFVVRFGPSWKV
mgnify:CR=1 FL=1